MRISFGLVVLGVANLVACSDPGSNSVPVDPADSAAADAGTFEGGPASVDAAPDAPSVGSSRGTGKVTCTSTGKLGASRTYCTGSLGGSEFKLAEPVGGSGPLRIVAYLHGDGAAAYKSDSAMKALLPFADANHALVVSVLSPNKCAWWQLPTQTDCSANAVAAPDLEGVNAEALRSILEALRAGFDVTNAKAFFFGSSGGSIFLTSAFLRRFGDQYPGVYALNCGGARPGKPFAWDTTSVSKRAATKLYFTYGDQDFLKPDIEVAISFFAGLGFPTDTNVVAGATHCAFDGFGRAVAVFNAEVGK